MEQYKADAQKTYNEVKLLCECFANSARKLVEDIKEPLLNLNRASEQIAEN